MDPKVRSMDAQILMEDLLQILEDTEAVPLLISGNSMAPFLVHSRDTVYLTKLTGPVKRGHMVLYRRTGGQYVLHRVFRAGADTLDMIGDGQVGVEPGIRYSQLLAAVSAVRRKGRLLKPGHPLWFFYEKIWIRVIRGRPRLLGLYRRLHPASK